MPDDHLPEKCCAPSRHTSSGTAHRRLAPGVTAPAFSPPRAPQPGPPAPAWYATCRCARMRSASSSRTMRSIVGAHDLVHEHVRSSASLTNASHGVVSLRTRSIDRPSRIGSRTLARPWMIDQRRRHAHLFVLEHHAAVVSVCGRTRSASFGRPSFMTRTSRSYAFRSKNARVMASIGGGPYVSMGACRPGDPGQVQQIAVVEVVVESAGASQTRVR